MPIPVHISTSQVPASFCPSNIAIDWPFLVELLAGTIGGNATIFVTGNATPDPADQDKAWFRFNSNGTPDKWYIFAQGSWLSHHPAATGSIILYRGTEASIKTFDGGEDSTPTETSGWMWQKVDDMDGRVPLGPGTLPVSEKVVAVTETGGVDENALIIAKANLPSSRLDIGINPAGTQGGITGETRAGIFGITSGKLNYNETIETTIFGQTQPMGDAEGLEQNNMPPYYGMWFIERTARLYYRI